MLSKLNKYLFFSNNNIGVNYGAYKVCTDPIKENLEIFQLII